MLQIYEDFSKKSNKLIKNLMILIFFLLFSGFWKRF